MTNDLEPRNEHGAGMLMRSLFFSDSEIQTSRVLDAALHQDLGNGALLARALLEALVDGPEGNDATKVLRTMPSELRAWTEVPLSDLRIGQAQRLDKRAGRVDLVLQDPAGDWMLAVELKVKAGYHAEQLETYSALGIPLVGLVMAPTAELGRQPAHLGAGWMGEVTWHQVRPALDAFKWPLGGRAVWHEFLDALYDARTARDSDDDELAAGLLEELLPTMAERLRELLHTHRPGVDTTPAVYHDVVHVEPDESARRAGVLAPQSDLDEADFGFMILLVVKDGRLAGIQALWLPDGPTPAITTTRPYERYVAAAMSTRRALDIPITTAEAEALGTLGAALRAAEPLLRVIASDLWPV